jgi:hypothetical protein
MLSQGCPFTGDVNGHPYRHTNEAQLDAGTAQQKSCTRRFLYWMPSYDAWHMIEDMIVSKYRYLVVPLNGRCRCHDIDGAARM